MNEVKVRRRGFCLTWNNYPHEIALDPDTNATSIRNRLFDANTMRYLIIGFEIAPNTGTPHLQMYVHYHTVKDIGYVRKRWPGCHVEPALGTPSQNYDYCSKGNAFCEYGTLPLDPGQAGGQKVKTDWQIVKDLAMKGQINEIEPRVYVQHYNTLHRIANDNQPPPDDLPEVCGTWFYGKPGTGKSYQCRLWAGDSRYDKLLSKWWNGYTGQDTVILDEVGPEHASWIGAFLKIWTDRYSFPAEIKGGVMNIRPKHFWITSNYTIETVFPGPNNREIREAVQRRCPEVHFLSNVEYLDFIQGKEDSLYSRRQYPNGNWFCRWVLDLTTSSPVRVKQEPTSPKFVEYQTEVAKYISISSDEEIEFPPESPNAQEETREQLLEKYATAIETFVHRAPMKALASPRRNLLLLENRARVLNFTDEEELRKILFDPGTESDDGSDDDVCDDCGHWASFSYPDCDCECHCVICGKGSDICNC
jgi:hypothetical protein